MKQFLHGSDVYGKNEIVVMGNTFAHRDIFRSLGGQWNADDKSWLICIEGVARNQQAKIAQKLSGLAGVRLEVR